MITFKIQIEQVLTYLKYHIRMGWNNIFKWYLTGNYVTTVWGSCAKKILDTVLISSGFTVPTRIQTIMKKFRSEKCDVKRVISSSQAWSLELLFKDSSSTKEISLNMSNSSSQIYRNRYTDLFWFSSIKYSLYQVNIVSKYNLWYYPKIFFSFLGFINN